MSNGPGSRDKILICARDLFYFVGFQTTSVDDILRECGVAKSNFYYHFRTKHELALAVMELHIAEFESSALQALSRTDIDPAHRLHRFCEVLIHAQSDSNQYGGCPFGNFAAGLSVRGADARCESFRALLCNVFGSLQATLTECLQEGIRTGAFRSDIPVDELAATLVAAIEGLMLMAKTHRSSAPLVHGLPVLQRLLRVD